MPELPDITIYVEALRRRLLGQPLQEVRLSTPFLLRTVAPSLPELIGKPVQGIERSGKRIVIELDGALFAVIHLMIAGRLHWKPRDAKVKVRKSLAAFEFPAGTLMLTEAGTKRRASLSLFRGRSALDEIDRGGLEVLEATVEQFAERLRAENHTLKRSLTDPRLFSAIGNAYSDEMLHRARLSPVTLTSRLSDAEVDTLFEATRDTLVEWTNHLRDEVGDGFPDKITAFRQGMAVHGRYGEPCPDCGKPVQRIRYADNETNYCAACQTSRLLK